jgi:hypothetical protein
MTVPGTPATTVPGRSFAFSMLISLRRSQRTKNLLVFARLLFGKRLFDTAAFVIFCAPSGSMYLINRSFGLVSPSFVSLLLYSATPSPW